MRISVIGISHQTAPVSVRELFALGDELTRGLLQTLHSEDVFDEAMVLDTCNRTEIYFVCKNEQDSLGYLLNHIARSKNNSPEIDESVFYRYDGISAVTHLFRVAAGLESQIVGEHQILGQVKDAYRIALEARTAKFFLNKVFHWAFRTGKRVQAETDLGRGSASVAQAGVDLASQIFARLAGKTVMLVGAGKTAELTAQALIRRKVGHVIVANRTLSRAEEVARSLICPEAADESGARSASQQAPDQQEQVRCPALLRLLAQRGETLEGILSSPSPSVQCTTEAIELSDAPNAIFGVDLVICSAASPEPLLTYEQLSGIIRHFDRSLFIVDIAVPRNVDPRIGRLPNVYLYNLDDLDGLVAQNIERRRGEIPKAEAIVTDEVQQFTKWVDSLQVAPTIKLLQQLFGQLREAEIGRYGKKFTKEDRQQLERFTEGLCNKILHHPITYLHQLPQEATNSDCLAAVDMIRRMFSLEDVEKE